jgi:hypothetical protein
MIKSSLLRLAETDPGRIAGQHAIDQLIEEHRRSGEPMVISPEPGIIQWVIPQPDGSMKVVREERVKK